MLNRENKINGTFEIKTLASFFLVVVVYVPSVITQEIPLVLIKIKN